MGGPDGLSEAQIGLARRSATLAVTIEQLESRLSEGDLEVDLDQLGRLIGHQRRVLETMGLKRVARVVNDESNVLADYFAKPVPRKRGS
jgi:hypothetical protein